MKQQKEKGVAKGYEYLDILLNTFYQKRIGKIVIQLNIKNQGLNIRRAKQTLEQEKKKQ